RSLPPLLPFSHFLTDTFNRQHDYLRISLTERCNLRCQYCMPAEGVELSPEGNLLTTPEILRLARLFVSQGVRKVRLTGGEPTIRSDILELVNELHAIPGLEEICITSNGLALHRKLPQLCESGLTALNLLLDTLVAGKFALITRRNGLSAVLRALHVALALGVRVKVNVVVMRGVNEDEILDFVAMARDHPLEVRFIEYMPFGGNKWLQGKMFDYADTMRIIARKYALTKVPHRAGDTAKVYSHPSFRGRVGFITSMTENFCGTCTRLRLTTDGNLKVCLFGNEEVSLRDMMRSGKTDGEILEVIGVAVKGKREKHDDMGVLENMPNRPMILIGG
ncbi:hypothetical protein BABINDRAFT_18435, partial [Babjeviella inositovora NRRL Y-12698]